jgi:GTP-binding protein Era
MTRPSTRPTDTEPSFRSGFVTLVGRPNVGKSSLVNAVVGSKVAITSARPQTTRTTVRGVRTTSSGQLVLLDTPGLHKPRTELGERTNRRARESLSEVDAVCLLVEATAPLGRGDRFIADLVRTVDTPRLLVVNKVDAASPAAVAEHLAEADARLGGPFDAYVPCSARTGEGVDRLVAELEARLPAGPHYYPDGIVTDQAETFIAAELLREQLLRATRDEVPHSISVSCRLLDEDDDEGGGVPAEVGARHGPDEVLRLLVTIRVERESQKGIVIGRGGAVMKQAATAARLALESLLGCRVYLECRVRVDRDWQRRPRSLDRMGF